MKFIKKLKAWFQDKEEMIKLFEEHERQFKMFSEILASKIKELHQDRVYFIPGITVGDVEMLMQEIKKRVPWTLPLIMIMNNSVEDYSIEELENIIKKLKQKGGSRKDESE